MAKKSNRGKSRGGRTNRWQREAAARLRSEKVERPDKSTAKPKPVDIDWLKTIKHEPRAKDWRLRKVLRALADGARLAFDRTKMTWYAITGAGRFGRIKIKWRLMLELRRCQFVDAMLKITNWGRYAAQAAL